MDINSANRLYILHIKKEKALQRLLYIFNDYRAVL